MTKRYRRKGINLLCGLLLALALAAAAPPGSLAQGDVPEFEVDAVSMRGEAASRQTRLDLYTRIPYANLSFINTPNGFSAAYEVAAAVYRLDERNRRESLVQTRIWESTALVDAFYLTQSPKSYDHTTHALELPPGRYLLEFQLTDKNTQGVFVQELPVEVRDLSRPVALSDIILLDDYEARTKTIFPRVGDRIGSEFFTLQLFYEAYADRPKQVRVTREVVPLRKRSSALIRAGRTLLGLPENEDPVAAVYTTVENTTLRRGRTQVVSQIPLTDLKVGDYLVRIRLEDATGSLLDQTERAFTAEWTGLADHLSNLDEAIDQLRYIAKKKELDEIKTASNYNDRLRRFQSFWQKRDPTPSTARNESMEEYYYRIAYANKNYGGGIPGWKTDRGQVLVSFGQPDHVDRHPHNYNVEPYEVWWYHRIGRRFIFIDKTGFGDFQLLVPIWDDRNRIR